MKLSIEFDDSDANQVANELVRMLPLALKLGVDVQATRNACDAGSTTAASTVGTSCRGAGS
jgi:hypothetical protein